jgi:hypothetical protein
MRLVWKGTLISGLDAFYGTYVASERDTKELEEGEDEAILWSCIRPEFRGAVSPVSHPDALGNKIRSLKLEAYKGELVDILARFCVSSPATPKTEGSSARSS